MIVCSIEYTLNSFSIFKNEYDYPQIYQAVDTKNVYGWGIWMTAQD